MKKGVFSQALVSILLLLHPAAAARAMATDFTTYSLEDLMETEITSAAKKPQKASESASAVYVITQENIRRSGAVNLLTGTNLIDNTYKSSGMLFMLAAKILSAALFTAG